MRELTCTLGIFASLALVISDGPLFPWVNLGGLVSMALFVWVVNARPRRIHRRNRCQAIPALEQLKQPRQF